MASGGDVDHSLSGSHGDHSLCTHGHVYHSLRTHGHVYHSLRTHMDDDRSRIYIWGNFEVAAQIGDRCSRTEGLTAARARTQAVKLTRAHRRKWTHSYRGDTERSHAAALGSRRSSAPQSLLYMIDES